MSLLPEIAGEWRGPHPSPPHDERVVVVRGRGPVVVQGYRSERGRLTVYEGRGPTLLAAMLECERARGER